MSGVCVDALNPAGNPGPNVLRAAGADGARLVAFDSDVFFDYTRELLADDLTVAVVIARESCANDDFGGWASWYASQLGGVHYVVLGNEPDGYLLGESPSSWSMDPPTYQAFWNVAAPAWLAQQPDAKLVLAGLVSGQVSFLDEVLTLGLDPWPNFFDIHPYSKDAAGAADLLDAYRAVGADALRDRLHAYRAVLAAHGL